MKQAIILVSLLISGTVGYTQNKTAATEKRATDVTLVGFESHLVQVG